MLKTDSPISIALGTFDGFHKGHMAVINKAKESQYPAYVLYFNKHPLEVITGKAPLSLLTDGVLERIKKENSLQFINCNFEDIVDLSCEEFFNKILIEELNVKEISCGENYTFGKGACGNIETLKRLCFENEVRLNVVDTEMYSGEPISSTRIRQAVECGKISEANAMLGRAFSYSLPVTDGYKLGRNLGFATANQQFPSSLIQPKRGVYASFVEIEAKKYAAVTNYGIRPTVNGKIPVSETHILNFSGNLYGKELEIHLIDFIRDEKKFDSLEALKEEVDKNKKTSQEIFTKYLEKLK